MNIMSPTGIPEWDGDNRRDITIDELLHMTSGLEWVENYFTISDATIMLMRSDDMVASVTGCELAHEPGSFWNYSGGDANLLSGLIRNTIGNQQAYLEYPYTHLFHRIGMLNTVMETDASGTFVFSSYCYGTTRDWARLGMLFLNRGIIEGDTVLTPEWVDYMTTASPESGGTYGATVWRKESDAERTLKDVPDDLFFADGFLGQRVYVIPSKKLVVVRMGYSLSNFNLNDFLRDIIATLPG